MIRVVLPLHLRRLAQVEGELRRDVEGPATLSAPCSARSRRAIRRCAARSATTTSALVILGRFLTDVGYLLLDPRVRHP